MTDIIFLTLPRLELRSPITAPAILKSVVQKHGFKAVCMDLNLDLWHRLDVEKHGHVWFDTDLTFRYEEKFLEFWEDQILPHALDWIEQFKKHDPRWIGITVFSQRTKWVTISMCKLIREKMPDVKLVIGGPFTEHLGPSMYEYKLIDCYVVGEGEEPIINILKGNISGPGINGTPATQIENLDTIPIPDYSDFPIHLYPTTWYDPRIKNPDEFGTEFIYITGSRGCVRKCSFCDVASIWPKFRYRSGASIAEEMMIQSNKYETKTFLFTDSLINGSIKQLKDLCETLISYKNSGMMSPVRWQGQFIARPEKQMPESMYQKMKEAGCWFVSIGVESGSEKVREDMKKMFTDADLYFTIEMCEKYDIQMAWLLMVGYPTETQEEFEKTLQLLHKYSYLNDRKLVRSIALGPTLDIVPGSPLYNNQKEMGIIWDDRGHWVYKDNTREVRIERWLKLKETCIELGYPVVEKATNHLLNELNQIKNDKQHKIYDHFNEGPMGPSV